MAPKRPGHKPGPCSVHIQGNQPGRYSGNATLSMAEQHSVLVTLLAGYRLITNTPSSGAHVSDNGESFADFTTRTISRVVWTMTGKSIEQVEALIANGQFAYEDFAPREEQPDPHPDLVTFRDRYGMVQWNKNGDHPNDGTADEEGRVVRYYRNPDHPGTEVHKYCARRYHDHGWIDPAILGEEYNFPQGVMVCPGQFVKADLGS